MRNLSSRSGTQKLRSRAPNVSQFDMLVEKFENFDKNIKEWQHWKSFFKRSDNLSHVHTEHNKLLAFQERCVKN